jgi:hypothetical protein
MPLERKPDSIEPVFGASDSRWRVTGAHRVLHNLFDGKGGIPAVGQLTMP